MKRNLTIIFWFMFLSSLYSQESDINKDSISFSLYVFNSCNSSVEKINNYVALLLKEQYLPDTTGICYLPTIGNYRIIGRSKESVIDEMVSISKNIELDTLTIRPIYMSYEYRTTGPDYNYYAYCGNKCDGKYKTYRKNGQVWQEGKFKEGKIIKYELYYPDGNVDTKIIDRKVFENSKYYDKNGILLLKYSFVLFITKFKSHSGENKKYYKRYYIGKQKIS